MTAVAPLHRAGLFASSTLTTNLRSPTQSTPNTAPVIEFNCLYTHDIRRKNKRWQDGCVKYHTFNRRIMLYDVPRNFLGDVHWKGRQELQEGDEVEIEGSAVVVQVAEEVTRTETDLSALTARRPRKEEIASSNPSATVLRQIDANRTTPRAHIASTAAHGKHRSLSSLLATPRGAIGKAALPSESPFDKRYSSAQTKLCENGRPQKKQKIGRTPEALPSVNNTDRPQTKRTATQARAASPLAPKNGDIIDLVTDDDEMSPSHHFFSSDVLEPLSPTVMDPTPQESRMPPPRNKRQAPTPMTSSSPAFQRMKSGPERRNCRQHESSVQHRDSEHIGDRCTANRQSDVPHGGGHERSVVATRQSERSTLLNNPKSDEGQPPTKRPGTTLRVGTGGSRKAVLLCQPQILPKSTTASRSVAPSISGARNKERKTQRQVLEERLAAMESRPVANVAPAATPANDDLEDVPAENDHGPRCGETGWMIGSKDQRPNVRAKPNGIDRSTTVIRPEVQHSLGLPLPKATDSRQAAAVPTEKQEPSGATISLRPPGAPVRLRHALSHDQPAQNRQIAAPQPPATICATAKLPQPAHSMPKAPAKCLQNANQRTTLASGIEKKPPVRQQVARQSSIPLPTKPPDPWSREAFDLFTWRPPGWNEEKWCVTGDSRRTNIMKVSASSVPRRQDGGLSVSPS